MTAPKPNNPRRPLLHPLSGMRLLRFVRTLSVHGGFAPRHVGQVALTCAGAVVRWPMCEVERLRVARRVAAERFDPPPIFIVGHWRSGTTYLHNLMSRDQGFCFPTILDALRPFEFYPSPLDVISRTLLLHSLPATRPMDDVPLHPGLPQEEELAMAVMGAPSFLNCLYFPGQMRAVFAREVLFEGLADSELQHWQQSLRYYLAKISVRYPSCRLLLKNPAHSARIQHLTSLFPGAVFVHIERRREDVIASMRKFYERMLPLVALQPYDLRGLDEHIAWSYDALMQRLDDGLLNLPGSRRVDVHYDQLVGDPAGTVAAIYRKLDIAAGPLAAHVHDGTVTSFRRRSRALASRSALPVKSTV